MSKRDLLLSTPFHKIIDSLLRLRSITAGDFARLLDITYWDASNWLLHGHRKLTGEELIFVAVRLGVEDPSYLIELQDRCVQCAPEDVKGCICRSLNKDKNCGGCDE